MRLRADEKHPIAAGCAEEQNAMRHGKTAQLIGRNSCQKAAGGRSFGTRGKIVASVGEAPKRVGISEWDSLEQVQAYLNSQARKDLVEGKKVVKINRQYIVEASN